MTVSEALKLSVSYPLDAKAIEKIAIERNLEGNATFSQSIAQSREYRLAQADVYMFAATAHNFSEADLSVSANGLLAQLIKKAQAIYSELGDSSEMAGTPTVEHIEDW